MVWLKEILRGVYNRMQVLSEAISNIIPKTRILTSLIIDLVYMIDYKAYKVVSGD